MKYYGTVNQDIKIVLFVDSSLQDNILDNGRGKKVAGNTQGP